MPLLAAVFGFHVAALVTRVEEIEQQSEVTRQPVSLIVADIDHFKQFNDSNGHAAGDALLTNLSYQLRKTLRAFDLCYRTGGEEFVVLLPGAELTQAATVAEQLREAAAALESGGHHVTMSFGVAASSAGQPFNYREIFLEADKALYQAKRAGRDRVQTAVGPPAPPQPLPTRRLLQARTAALNDGDELQELSDRRHTRV